MGPTEMILLSFLASMTGLIGVFGATGLAVRPPGRKSW
jgi:hypothetical protein